MRSFKSLNVLILVFGIFFTGCAGRPQLVPRHNQVLTFNLPYDLTYLRVEESLERIEGWEVEMTEKEKGVIVIRNINYSAFDDEDKRSATFWVKRVGPKETSVRLAPQSERVVGGGTLMDHISDYIKRQKGLTA